MPIPVVIAYMTGVLLIAFGVTMCVKKYAINGGKCTGMLMLVLTTILYVPQFFLAHGVSEQVVAINFVADTLLFSGTMLVITNAIFASASGAQPLARAQTAFEKI